MTRWRLEIFGRGGWFRPGVEASYPVGTSKEDIQENLWRMLKSYHGDLHEGETLSLAQVLKPEPYRPSAKR